MDDQSEASSLSKHAALVIAALSGAGVLARVLVVANYDLTVGLAILAASSGPSLLLGTALTLLPLVLPALAVATWDIRRLRPEGSLERNLWGLAEVGTVYAVVVLTPVGLLLTWIAALVLSWTIARVLRRRGAGPRQKRAVSVPTYYALIAGVPVVWWMLTLPQPWMPPERFSTATGTTTGYMLGTSGTWVSILQDRPRIVLSVPGGDILAREYCRRPMEWYSRSLTTSRVSDLPPCD